MGLDLKKLQEPSEAKTFRSLMDVWINRAEKSKNYEMTMFLKEIKSKYIQLEKPSNKPYMEVSIIDGWKGKDKLFIKAFENNFIIKTHIKDKETGEIKTRKLIIPKENVNRLLFYIKKWKIGEQRKCYDFANVCGYKEWKDLWKWRRIYFMTYYYPIKILESIGIINYSGRGKITRIA